MTSDVFAGAETSILGVPPVGLGALSAIDLDAATYEAHPIHGTARVWTETNCYVDLWVELLHSLGADPIPALAFVLSAGCDGRQWDFVKFEPEDLRRLYGIEVAEMNIWRPLTDHIQESLTDGALTTVEVDGFWLPDTNGTSYRNQHTKTTIVPNSFDSLNRTLGYFHNRGYYQLAGDDFDGVFGLAPAAPEQVLVPYVERVKFDRSVITSGFGDADLDIARGHLARRSAGNPVERLADRVIADVPWVQSHGPDAFHLWSFGLLRQCGATAELAADLCGYLEGRGVEGAVEAVPHFLQVASGAKAVQFRMARAARGRSVSLDEPLASMSEHWDQAMQRIISAL